MAVLLRRCRLDRTSEVERLDGPERYTHIEYEAAGWDDEDEGEDEVAWDDWEVQQEASMEAVENKRQSGLQQPLSASAMRDLLSSARRR